MQRRFGILLFSLVAWTAGAGAAVPGRFVTVALEGEPAPGGQETIRMVNGALSLNDRGDVGYLVTLGDPGSGLHAAFVRFAEGGFDVVRSDDPPPPGLGSHYSWLDGPEVNDDRDFAMTVGASPDGWILKSGGSVSLLLRVGDPVPGRAGYTYDLNPTEIDLNASGELLLATSLQGPSGWSNGIVVVGATGHDVVAINGDPAPTPGADPFSYVSDHAHLNDAGDVVFYGEVAVLSPGRGIFARLGGELTLIAIEGQPAPVPSGQSFEFPWNPDPSINEAGTIVFAAGLSPCCSVPDTGIFEWQGETLTALALEGDPVPDSGGRIFDNVWGARINTAGAVVFEGTSYDADEQLISGIYWIEDGVVSKVIESGDPIPGTGSTLGGLTTWALRINESGDIAFCAELADGRMGVFLMTNAAPVPALGAASLALVAALLGAAAWRSSNSGG